MHNNILLDGISNMEFSKNCMLNSLNIVLTQYIKNILVVSLVSYFDYIIIEYNYFILSSIMFFLNKIKILIKYTIQFNYVH